MFWRIETNRWRPAGITKGKPKVAGDQVTHSKERVELKLWKGLKGRDQGSKTSERNWGCQMAMMT